MTCEVFEYCWLSEAEISRIRTVTSDEVPYNTDKERCCLRSLRCPSKLRDKDFDATPKPNAKFCMELVTFVLTTNLLGLSRWQI